MSGFSFQQGWPGGKGQHEGLITFVVSMSPPATAANGFAAGKAMNTRQALAFQSWPHPVQFVNPCIPDFPHIVIELFVSIANLPVVMFYSCRSPSYACLIRSIKLGTLPLI
ncbi:hypothetical protein P7H06_21795 [Paenibacillus larvae]|nr:hypothetical protein [Paenibacillus larvae]MDT2261598.1 hypothetical protein [Paenibacillus larvae]